MQTIQAGSTLLVVWNDRNLMVMKPLPMECLVAVVTLDHLLCEVTLSLMVGQNYLIPSLERAARMAAV